MFERPEIVQLAQELASHAAQRQARIAENVANADTPNYRARDLEAFTTYYEARSSADLKATREAHMPNAQFGHSPAAIIDTQNEASPNGNTVSLETEMIRQAETRHQHDLALSVYKSSLDLMRTAIGRGR